MPRNITKHACILYIRFIKLWKQMWPQTCTVNLLFDLIIDCRFQLCFLRSFVYILKCGHAEICILTSLITPKHRFWILQLPNCSCILPNRNYFWTCGILSRLKMRPEGQIIIFNFSTFDKADLLYVLYPLLCNNLEFLVYINYIWLYSILS